MPFFVSVSITVPSTASRFWLLCSYKAKASAFWVTNLLCCLSVFQIAIVGVRAHVSGNSRLSSLRNDAKCRHTLCLPAPLAFLCFLFYS